MRPAWPVVRRYAAAEARQAVAVDSTHFYAIDNRRIGKYDKQSGAKVVEINPEPSAATTHVDCFLQGPAGQILPTLL